MMGNRASTPAIPEQHTRTGTVRFWGVEYEITPAVCDAALGDGRQLLGFQPLNTRPNYYLIRVDSRWDDGEADDIRDHLCEIIDALADEFSEIEREREYLIEDGVDPADADLDGHEAELGWPVLSLDSGYCWWTEAEL